MRKLLPILALALASVAFAGEDSAAVKLNVAEAAAKAQSKDVLVIFHASWCHWCKKLDELIANPKYSQIFQDNYVIVHVDVLEQGDKKSLETPGGAQLSTQLGADGEGLPYTVCLSSKGQKLFDSEKSATKGSNIGYPSEPDEVTYFMAQLKKTAPRLTAAQASDLEAYLRAKS